MAECLDRDNWAAYTPWLRAIFDEYARAIEEFDSVVLAISPEEYLASSSLADEEFPNLRAIMWHVVGACFVYSDYLETALTGNDGARREHDYAYDTTSEAVASLGAAFGATVHVLALAKGRSDAELEKLQVVTRWKQVYDIEQMLEHAIVHILRHRRQIERWLQAIRA